MPFRTGPRQYIFILYILEFYQLNRVNTSGNSMDYSHFVRAISPFIGLGMINLFAVVEAQKIKVGL